VVIYKHLACNLLKYEQICAYDDGG
jgi:hypothetical protein